MTFSFYLNNFLDLFYSILYNEYRVCFTHIENGGLIWKML